MEYIKFGNTGMKVSRLCLGTMTYGKPNERWQWALNEERALPATSGTWTFVNIN